MCFNFQLTYLTSSSKSLDPLDLLNNGHLMWGHDADKHYQIMFYITSFLKNAARYIQRSRQMPIK